MNHSSRRNFLMAAGAFLLPQSLLAKEEKRFAAVLDYCKKSSGRSLIVWEKKRIVLEDYHNKSHANDARDVRSITKNLWAMAILKASEEKKCKINQLASDILPEWKTHRWKSKITISHLLTQTSGLDGGANLIYGEGIRDLYKALPKVASHHAPGEVFDYGPSNYEWLSVILQRILGDKITGAEYVQQKICQAAGMGRITFRTDRKGIPFASAAARLTARQLLNFGLMILNQGGNVLGKNSLGQAMVGTAANPDYGMSLWLNQTVKNRVPAFSMEDLISIEPGKVNWAGACLATSAPADMLTLLGSSGQRVYIVPSQERVIVRLGEGKEFKDEIFWKFLA